MTAATIQRTVDTSLETADAENRIQAAAIIGKLRAMDPVVFAEYIGEMLETGDIKLCQSAFMQIKMRRSEERVHGVSDSELAESKAA